MPNLSVKTRGNASPQGKPRVYFSCCPEDLEVYFEPLCADIFAAQDCAVYYNAEPDTPADETQLADMQLFVVPVTTKYLFRPCRAREAEYAFAMAHHIPVLPIAVESGLSTMFAEVMNRVGAGYGDVQLLKRASDDETEIPYVEKLEKLLGSILVGDELAERVRAAFDAYIFLSYRKKDRAYARDLMRLIHRIPYCRDIAIWYDEFLVPGEGWNKAIREAMAKSRLVTMAVTPSVIEPDNFIIRHEYPDAVASGKEVIPAELVPTDRDALACLFRDIAEPIDGHDEKALEAALHGMAVQENDESPEHNFLIGLAYLSAIDVERDPERAVRLITSAAEAGLPEAIEKLVSMYNTGEGAERDYPAAAQWQEKLVTVLEKTKPDPLADREIFLALKDAGKMWKKLSRLPEAGQAYDRMRVYAEVRDAREHSASTRQDAAVSYERLGSVRKAQGDLAGAMEYYLRSLQINEELAAETQTAGARRELSVSCNDCGDIRKEEGDPAGAREYYMQSLRLREVLAREEKTVKARRDLSVSYERVAGICMAEGDIAAAKEYYRHSLQLREALAAEAETVKERRNLAIGCGYLGDVFLAERNIAQAQAYYRKGLELFEVLASETGTIESRRDLGVVFNRIGGICEGTGDLAGAEAYYRKGLQLSGELASETGTIEARRDLSISCEKVGNICGAEGNIAAAREYCLQALRLREALAEETDTVQAWDDLAFTYYMLAYRGVGGREMLQKAYEICCRLEKGCPNNAGYAERRKFMEDILNRQ